MRRRHGLGLLFFGPHERVQVVHARQHDGAERQTDEQETDVGRADGGLFPEADLSAASE